MIVLLVALIPVLQPQTVAARRHHDDESSGDQSSGPSLTDKICRVLNSGGGVALIPLLHAAGIATGGTLNAAVAAATALCAARG
jgi:hypothetical protein